MISHQAMQAAVEEEKERNQELHKQEREMACSKTYSAAFPASINRGRSVVVPRANPSFPNSRSFQTSRINLLRCNTTGDSGESGCKMLDAFFLGKVIGEIIYERIESSMGEFVGVIGRLQSDQLKHVTQFQEEVLVKARRAKEEAMQLGLTSTVKETAEEISEAAQQVADEAQGLISEAAEQATEKAQGLISSVAPSVVSKAASSLLDRATQNPFNKD